MSGPDATVGPDGETETKPINRARRMGAIPSGGMWKVHTMNTKLSRFTSIAITAAFLGAVLVTFVPPAAAQNQNLNVVVKVIDDSELPSQRLLPETGKANVKVEVTVIFNTGGGCVVPATITYKVTSSPGYSTPIFNPAQTTVTLKSSQASGAAPASTANEEVKTSSVLIITTNREAPAFQDGQYKVQVTAVAGQASTGTCNYNNGVGDGQALVKNDYLPITIINPTSLFQKSGQNKKVVFPVEVQNLGNGPTRIKVETSPISKERLDSVNPGAEIRLESRAGKGPSALYKTTRNIEVVTPHSNGYTNSIYTFQAKYSSIFDGTAPGTVATDEATVVFSVQVQGVYVPGFDPLGVLAALGVGLLAFARIARRR